ncbi:MAG: hypothetical protein ABL907_23725 [Hyphomicrobium sp.]
MKATELAHAVGAIAAARPEFEPSLATAITKWLVDSFFKSPDLATLRSAAQGDGAKVLVSHVRSLRKPDLTKLLKKIDPHFPKELLATEGMLSEHVIDLILGKISQSTKPEKKPSAKPAPLPFDEVIRINDSELRRRELDKLKPAELKKCIKERKIDHLSLSSKASKLEMVEHIEAALAAGWPEQRGIMHPSQS